MLNPDLIKDCESDSLLFLAKGIDDYDWIKYVDIISQCIKDEDFVCIYKILEALALQKEFDEVFIDDFESNTIEPEQKNLKQYYRERAESEVPYDDVIKDCSHICDDAIELVCLPENVGYIGHTAYAYCNRLRAIEIKNPHVLFGMFPIMECEKLKAIIVPEESLAYYERELPYYSDIIVTNTDISKFLVVENEEEDNEVIEDDDSLIVDKGNLSFEKKIDEIDNNKEISDEEVEEAFVPNENAIRDLSDTCKQTFELLQKGYDAEEIAEYRNRNVSTIFSHIAEFIRLGLVDVDEYVELDDYNEIVDAYNAIDEPTSGKIKSYLGKRQSYSKINYVLADIDRLNSDSEVSNNDYEEENDEEYVDNEVEVYAEETVDEVVEEVTDSKVEKRDDVSARAGARWTPEEEKEIVEYFRAGFSFEDIAEHQGRSVVSIKARLGMLGEIDYKYEKGKEIIGVPYQVLREETMIEPQIIEEPEEKEDDYEVEIDESKLYNVFKSKATSYKYFWLYAIITLVREKGVLAYSYKELMIRMVARAWPLLKQDNLDFGKTDRLLNIIDNIRTHAVINGVTPDAVEMQISAQYDRNNLNKYIEQLGKNVPYRFLSPWIKYTSDGDVIAKSNDSQYATPYALYEDGIVIDEDWYDYFINNYDKVYDFIFSELYGYLKQYNEELKMTRFKFKKL